VTQLQGLGPRRCRQTSRPPRTLRSRSSRRWCRLDRRRSPRSPSAAPARLEHGALAPRGRRGVLVLGGAGLAVSLVGSGLDGGSDSATSAAGGSAELAAPSASDLLLTASGEDWSDPATPASALPRVLGGQATAYRLSDDADVRARGSEDAEGGEEAEPRRPTSRSRRRQPRSRCRRASRSWPGCARRRAWRPAWPRCSRRRAPRSRGPGRSPWTTRPSAASPRWPWCSPTRTPPGVDLRRRVRLQRRRPGRPAVPAGAPAVAAGPRGKSEPGQTVPRRSRTRGEAVR
jgi:hypothetical protein